MLDCVNIEAMASYSQTYYRLLLIAPYGGGPLWWWVGLACRDQNGHQPPGLSYVSDTALSHEWQTFYSGSLLTCIISK